MSVSRRQALIAGAGALPVAGVLAAAVKGQNSPQVGQQPGGTVQPGTAGAAPGQPASGRGEDPLLAANLLTGGRRQIEVCRWAMDRLKNQDCKAFAKAEIDEHEKIKADLNAKFGFTPPTPVAVDAGGAAPGAAGGVVQPPAAGRPAGATPPVVAVGRVVFPPELSQQLKVQDEVVTQCVANYKAMMTKKEQEKGELKFDKAFVGDQLHEHQGLKDKVEVFRRHASAEMQPVLDQGLQIINQHIATCESLMQKLEGQQMQGERRSNG